MAESPDIVARITQNINAFQYSKVHITGPLEVVTPAARVDDIINHTSFWSALAGAVVGAVVTAGIFALAAAGVAAVGITGGLAGPIVAAAVGALATFALSGGISQISGAVTKFVDEAIGGEPSGPIIKGSTDVYVNGKPLAMADLELSVGCTRHSPPPKIAQGSETVSVNNKPVARKGDKTECSATIAEGSPNVFIGSGQGTYVEMKSEFTGFQRALLFAVEFVIPPTAIFGKGIAKGLAKVGKALVTKGPRVSAAIAARMAGRAAKGLATGAARKAQSVAKAARAVSRGAAKGAKAVGRGVAKGAKTVGKGIGKGAKQAGKIARGKTLGCAKCAFKNNKGIKRFTEAAKKFVKGDPIDVLSGHIVEQRTDFTLGQTLPLSFIRTWSRHKDEQQSEGLCGRFWTDNFSEYAEVSDNGRHVKIATFEGTYLRFALPQGGAESFNPDHPNYALIRHREYFELFNRDTRISKLFYFIETAEIDDADAESASESESDLTFPPIPDGRYLISAWLDTFDNAVQFHYNAQSWLESVSHTDGIILTLTYQGDWLHQITRVDNGQQQVLVTYTQDEHGHLIESDALLDYHLFYRYDSRSNLTRWADNDKTWVDYHYDEQGRVIHSIGADGFYPVWFEYGENQTRVRDGKGNVTVTVYDYDPHIMKPLVITSPSGRQTRFAYDRYGNLLTQTFADGSQVSFDYLEQTGLVTSFTDPSGERWQYGYDDNEQLIRIEDPIGRVWQAAEHKTDSQTTALFTAPDGSQTEFIRNEYGLLTQIIRKNHGETGRLQTAFYRYDPRHRLIESQDAEQRRIQLSYNAEDQVNQLKTANGHFWHYGYNAHAKLTNTARPNQSSETHIYDRHGNLTKYTDANGVVWQLKYGAFDLLMEKIDGEGNRWQYAYDKDSLKLQEVTNPKGERYTYTFNADGQVETETDFAGNVWQYAYNELGQLHQLTDGEGDNAYYHYETSGQLSELICKDNRYTYTYDKVGRVTQIQSIDSTLTYRYDVNDRIVEETQNNHKIHRTFDDENHSVTRTLILEGQAPIVTRFKYNQVGELVQLDLPNTSGQKQQLFCKYDANGNEIQRTSNQGFIFNQRFDEMDCLTHQRAGHEPRTHFNSAELRQTGIDSPSFAELNRTYTYDKALNTLAANDELESLKFVVNGNNQIVTVQNGTALRESYGYDNCGYLSKQHIGTRDGLIRDQDHPEYRDQRIVNHHDLYQTGHKLNRIGNCHYEYDNAGRLTEKTEYRDGFRHKTTYFHWNGNNQLESVTNAQGEVWYYKYDALGRRIEKACPERHTRTGYVWDGDQIAYQYTEKQGKRESHRHSVFNGWELIAQQDGYFKHDLRTNEKTWTEETHYAVSQPNGQVLALFNPQGKRTWRKQPTSLWGLPLLNHWERKQSEPINPNLLFAGQYYDEESNLAYNRFRYYDPQSGNYLTSDPIGLNGGETPYGYVHNPMGWVDPFGLAKCPSKYSHLTREQRQARINELAEANAHRRLQEMQAQNPRSHFLDRHGAQTTLQQQQVRAQTGLNPEGSQGRVPPAATRFLSHRDQLNAIQRAQTIYRQTGKPAPSVRFTSVVGEGYRGTQYFQTQQAKVVFRGSENDIITAFPE